MEEEKGAIEAENGTKRVPANRMFSDLRINIGEGEGGASLPPDDPAEARFAFDDAIRDAHLATEGRKMHHQLDGVHVVGDHHQLSRLLLDQSRHLRAGAVMAARGEAGGESGTGVDRGWKEIVAGMGGDSGGGGRR